MLLMASIAGRTRSPTLVTGCGRACHFDNAAARLRTQGAREELRRLALGSLPLGR